MPDRDVPVAADAAGTGTAAIMKSAAGTLAARLLGRAPPRAIHERVRVRIARATHQLDAVVAFYRDGLGLPVIETFHNHAGYSGVILGMPGGAHLEFTQHDTVRRTAASDADDLLVFYLPTRAKVERLRRRLEYRGHRSVQPVNPYWLDRSVSFEDPDHWRVVLCAEPE
jgi:catechol 2,3-dioxygenase-like lactoylglutathione lyase family enzyme